MLRQLGIVMASLVLLSCSALGLAEGDISAGLWGTYQYLPDDEVNKNSGGEFTGEALILYADGHADKGEGRWLYSAELRMGPGSFTDRANNSTGDELALHKAWVGWKLNDTNTLRVGKTQVPYGWKTVNFWPGDILLAGYGDQMDVGIKYTGSHNRLDYDAAFYLQDDWGATSTDTLDDNGHWGSSTSYRKVQTWVANATYEFVDNQKIGVSLQSGKLQDLSGGEGYSRPLSGSHKAGIIYYEGKQGNLSTKASYNLTSRNLPRDYRAVAGLPKKIKNQRLAAEIGYQKEHSPWFFYLDASMANPDTRGSNARAVTAFAPGVRYDYGPGWVYLEYLTQDGYVDRNGQVGEGDFNALYVSLDFYL